ncbi:hypothetical protein BJ322DRAFT_1104598 [Thelephora terrestris]|uniref:Uncharacterized protein n=1 Tax=Thelephora terrestris TaxID=56493 RepID=A0A9P6LB78_9AGAM|nr:hypothetical protein BJ322DRAFT_1104598 [Thelephora terrestris]
MPIQDIKIINNTVFVADTHKIASWDLKAAVIDTYWAETMTTNQIFATDPDVAHVTLSHDCSQIAFTRGNEIFLHNPMTQKTISQVIVQAPSSICFSPDGSHLWAIRSQQWLMRLNILKSWKYVEVPVEETKETELFNSPPHGYYIGDSMWITDSKGSKLLWLPPNLRKSPLS